LGIPQDFYALALAVFTKKMQKGGHLEHAQSALADLSRAEPLCARIVPQNLFSLVLRSSLLYDFAKTWLEQHNVSFEFIVSVVAAV